MRIVIPGGSGQLGSLLERHFQARGHTVHVLSRRARKMDWLEWDGETLGAWKNVIDGADIVINLAGRTVNCRYTESNMKQMMDSRVRSTEVIGRAIEEAERPPPLWLQMSTATIYAHRFDAPNDEHTGVIGGDEPDVPGYWAYSVDIAKAWERALMEANTPNTRRVALRTSIVMSEDEGGAFDVLRKMTSLGLGGPIGGGKQFVSWIHGDDFVRAVEHIIEDEELTGPINLASPNPLPQREFQQGLRAAINMPIGLPAMKWMAEIGAFVLQTDTELLLKSRYVVPTRLLESGFEFEFPKWPEAARDLTA